MPIVSKPPKNNLLRKKHHLNSEMYYRKRTLELMLHIENLHLAIQVPFTAKITLSPRN